MCMCVCLYRFMGNQWRALCARSLFPCFVIMRRLITTDDANKSGFLEGVIVEAVYLSASGAFIRRAADCNERDTTFALGIVFSEVG